jgi:hypothetical protein
MNDSIFDIVFRDGLWEGLKLEELDRVLDRYSACRVSMIGKLLLG